APVFEASRESASRPWGELVLDLHALRSWGYLRAPGSVWRAMSRLGSWIEPVLISEWCRLIRRYAERAGIVVAPGIAEAALAWNEPSRETVVGRQAMSRLAESRPIVCVWSGADLDHRTLDVDHCLPWAIWPCGDLWNLMPARRTINQHQKRDRLPSARMLSQAKDRILNWWEEAWLSDAALEDRFYREAAAALPLSSGRDVEDVFSGLDWRRLRLRQDQQVPEWDLVSKGL
ncbi:MAG TPA: hypothetical protein VK472_07260, partial [Allosphingosinicella sp.]|nr:hypothetical protein [Allosphingosinicella sp.]